MLCIIAHSIYPKMVIQYVRQLLKHSFVRGTFRVFVARRRAKNPSKLLAMAAVSYKIPPIIEEKKTHTHTETYAQWGTMACSYISIFPIDSQMNTWSSRKTENAHEIDFGLTRVCVCVCENVYEEWPKHEQTKIRRWIKRRTGVISHVINAYIRFYSMVAWSF